MSHETEGPTVTENFPLEANFNPRIIRRVKPNGEREGLFGSLLRHHLELLVPEGNEHLLDGRENKQAYVYKVNPKTGEGTVDTRIFGTDGRAYGLPTRSLLDPRAIMHFFGPRRHARWTLVTFDGPTANPPEVLTGDKLTTARANRTITRRPLQSPART